ncbi:ubiquitin-like small modifier protein 1 [Halanaeroarchaeum sulfurireducens]|uniref:Molybdopterin converting factor, small subunit n=1 Tax=Halanaeroarchaeum sulfurireducens TaxID=1604004 RepID=A0A0F7PGF3_9EURY|nr:ubiquitin-like small modifier protein 1 [Halanaeroarchaeum sulfurireducens]AKH98383.1 molybdopterin converting factor, small subunit [Halanaeroarchaeum sulfurireducens]ALG82777.1 molybdopterin converting factor, small subunit [Halanaeroarchaeum sulfurireducens]
MQVKLFADLAEAAGEKRVDLDLDGDATVGEAVDALVDAYPGLAERVLADDGALVDRVNVLRNGENVFAAADGLETPIDGDDELALFPPVSGG